jgi:membrane fusion protein, multidrug efflux system
MRKVVACCVLLLCTAVVFMNACSPKKKPPVNKPVPVMVAVATQKSIPVQMTAMGSVEAFQTISVRTQITAQIAKVFFKEGQEVKKGDLLLTLDCRTNEAALAQAQANLAKDKVQADYAREQSRRYADLIKKDYVAKEQFDQIQANAVALEATLKADEAIVESNRVQMQYCSIYSPIDGRTGMLKVNQGNIVKVNDTEILTINQIQPINVTFAIPEKDLPMVKKYSMEKTLKIEAFIPGEEHPEKGELTFVDNAIDRTTGTITIKGTFANKEKRFVPGQYVNVVLTLTVQPDAVLVPSQGVEQGQTGQYVYVIGPDSTAEMRPVTIGGEIKGETVIVTGLNPGERIVTDGQMRLTPGVKVTMKTSK